MLTQSNDVERFYDTAFSDVNEDLYNSLIRQVKTQRDTLNLLHLQRKSQGEQDIETVLAEKDRLILSLQSKIEQTNSNQDLSELENEVYDLEERLRQKNKKIRELEDSYNLHLNRLTDEITALKQSTPTKNTSVPTPDVNQSNLEKDLQESKHQIQFLENQVASLQEMGHSEENIELQAQVFELQKKLNSENSNTKTDAELQKVQAQNLKMQQKSQDQILELQTINSSLQDQLANHQNSSQSHVESNIYTLIELHKNITNIFEKQDVDSSKQRHLELILHELFSQNQLQVFSSIGSKFCADSHQIVDTIYCSDESHNMVFKEISQGFIHKNNIVQRAQVIVAKNPYYCGECDKIGIKDSKFCFHCGTKLLGTDNIQSLAPIVNDQDNATSYLELGEAFLKKQDYPQALSAFEKSLKLSNSNLAIIGVTKTLEAQAKYKEALETFQLFDQNASGNNLKLEIENRILAKIKIVEQLQYLV
ncbi:MAG: nucleotide exchange factor GrpE [Candidatus Cloacimonetes bacterium]|nr:nucleotide exchange factor GrpE [Candidatus Cloacimonadota bacterium]